MSASAPSAASATGSTGRKPPEPGPADGIRARLLRWLVGPLALLLAVSLISDYQIATERSEEAFDIALADGAFDIAALARLDAAGTLHLDLSPQAEEVLRTETYDSIYFAVWDRNGRFVAGDPDLPRPSAGIAGATRGPTVYFDDQYRGRVVRGVLYRLDDRGRQGDIVVAETTRKRDVAARRTMIAMVIPNVVLVGATLLLVFFAVQIGLRPLDHLRAEIGRRSPGDLRQIDLAPVPSEVRPMIGALNELFRLLVEASAMQRRFVADAAHQLRTPLTAVQTQLDLLALDPDQAVPRATLERIESATGRITHLVNQLLVLSRAEPAANLGQVFVATDLKAVVESSASIFLDRAIAKDIDLGFEADPATVRGIQWLLAEALANLVDNAVRYTPAGGRVTVRSGTERGAPFIEVEDTGPGIPSAERERVCERFYRSPGTVGDGCGLGLAIVKEIVSLHRAVLAIGAGGDGIGTRVRLTFPQPVEASIPG